MSLRRAALPLLSVALLGAGTGCEKPTPYVSVFANGKYARTRAVSYCFEADDCRNYPGEEAVLEISGQTEIAIEVPRELAKHGWSISEIPNRPPSKKQYDTIGPVRFEPSQRQPISIVRLRADGSVDARWNFVLVGS